MSSVRDTNRLDATRVLTELGPALATTVEQTVLDLTKRPALGNAAQEAASAIDTLYSHCDPDVLTDIAQQQKMRATLTRLHNRMREPT